MTDCRLLFVYGSLRRVFGHPMHQWLVRHARWVGEATFQGALFSLGDFPGAVPSAHPAEKVGGEVYEVLDARPLFDRLDEYEDYFPENPGASLYLRQVHGVELAGGERVNAWVYVYNRPVDGLPRMASGDWKEGAGRRRRF